MILYCSAIYRLQNKKIKKSSPKFHSLCARLLKISEHLVEDTEGEQIPERRREGSGVTECSSKPAVTHNTQTQVLLLRTFVPNIVINSDSELKTYILQLLFKVQ